MAEPSPIPSHSSPPTRAPSSEAPSHRSDPPSATARPTIPTLIVPLAPSTSSTSGGERGIVIGTSSALAVLLAASCVLLYAQYRRTARCPGYPNTIKDSPLGGRGPDRLVDEVREPWRKYHHHASTSLSMMSYIMGHNHCSSGSSSSSFRDYRFVAVFDPEGAPIPQFNPNTAAAVIIGSVTIGCADNSSFGSGPFADVGSSSIMSRSFFSLGGTMSRRRGSGTPVSEGGISSRDDVSSLSSRRSPKRANPNRYRSMNQRGGEGSTWLVDRRKRIGKRDPIGPSSMSSLSETSHYTVPVSHRRLRTIEGRVDDGDRQVSFGDWVAISNITEFRHRGSFTDAAAMLSQRKVFFNALCPESVPSSKGLSLPDIHRVARVVSSDAGASSLCEWTNLPSVTLDFYILLLISLIACYALFFSSSQPNRTSKMPNNQRAHGSRRQQRRRSNPFRTTMRSFLGGKRDFPHPYSCPMTGNRTRQRHLPQDLILQTRGNASNFFAQPRPCSRSTQRELTRRIGFHSRKGSTATSAANIALRTIRRSFR
jgi:hypothetical protein